MTTTNANSLRPILDENRFTVGYVGELTRFGARGWNWRRYDADGQHGEEYRTNGAGRGLWRYDDEGRPHQISGTTQFRLPVGASKALSALTHAPAE